MRASNGCPVVTPLSIPAESACKLRGGQGGFDCTDHDRRSRLGGTFGMCATELA